MSNVFKVLSIIAGIGLVIFCVLRDPKDKLPSEETIKERSAIDSLYIKFEGYIREGNFAGAYNLMSHSYQSHEHLESFTETFQFLQEKEEYRLHPQRLLQLEGDTAILFPHDTSSSEWWLGIGFEFKKIEGKWYLTGKIITYQD